MFDLSGRTALVTGASGGIGGAIARALHAQGAVVSLSGTREAALQQLADELGSRVHVLPCNLADKTALDGLIASAETAMGGLDLLVNNAGVIRDNLFIRMKDEEWDQVLRVNLDSAFYLTRAAVKNMMRRRFGRVIFITSVVGSMGNPGQANYAASKAAISAMAKSVGQEVASRNITLNCIAPGFIQTPMTDVLNEKQTEAMLQRIPAGRYGTPDEVASTAVFLASNEAAYVTGQTVHVNGGMIMI